MRKLIKRLESDLSKIMQPVFMSLCRLYKETDFTRNRKMPLSNLILSLVFRKGRTLYIELREFSRIYNINEGISKVAYLKQRMKLNPLAFHELMRFHAHNFYKDWDTVQRWKGYIIAATDGSTCNAPLTAENVEIYGTATTTGNRERPQIGISCLYDAVNRVIIDMSIDAGKFNERTAAMKHIESSSYVLGKIPRIYVFDRGYPSGELFVDLMGAELKFVTRLSSICFKREQMSITSDDEWVDIVFDKTRTNVHKGLGNTATFDKLTNAGSISLRFIRVRKENGSHEFLATNLSTDEFSTSDIHEIYHMRWGIESAYDDMKNKLQIENFTGKKQIIMEQDIYATGYLFNIISDIMADAEFEHGEKKEASTNSTHPMQLNKNIAIGIIKEDLPKLILAKTLKKRREIMNSIVAEIKMNLLPVRPGRSFPRTKYRLAVKHSNVRKRSY